MPNWNDFSLIDGDDKLIATASAEGKLNWESDSLSTIKKRIKDLHLGLQGASCCYCKRSLHDEFGMVIDIEHVVPKGQFPWSAFLAVNLSVSCKRCNMRIKKNRVDFLISENDDEVTKHIGSSDFYKFIHPNLDTYSEHLKFFRLDNDGKRLVKFRVGAASPKGQYTYEFFELKEAEENAFDRLQGIELDIDDNRVAAILEVLSA